MVVNNFHIGLWGTSLNIHGDGRGNGGKIVSHGTVDQSPFLSIILLGQQFKFLVEKARLWADSALNMTSKL